MISRSMLAIVVSFCASGCGTFFNVVNFKTAPQSLPSIESEGKNIAPREIYGGIKLAAGAGLGWFEERRPFFGLYMWGVDLPLSTVGDTLTLPLTIRATIDRGIEDYYFRDEPADQTSQDEDVREVSFEE